MGLYIIGDKADRDRVAEALKKLHPNILVIEDPNHKRQSCAIQLHPGGGKRPGGKCLQTLISSTKNTVIEALPGPGSKPMGGGETIGDRGGGTSMPWPPSPSGTDHLQTPSGKNGPGTGAYVAVYASDNNGKGYYTFDAAGRPINDPLFAILANELSDGHAFQFVTGSTPRIRADAEKKSIDHENDIRGSTKPPKGTKPYAKRGLAAGAAPVGTGGVTTRPPNSY